MFTKKGYAIYVLDDYSIYLMPEVRQALLKKGKKGVCPCCHWWWHHW